MKLRVFLPVAIAALAATLAVALHEYTGSWNPGPLGQPVSAGTLAAWSKGGNVRFTELKPSPQAIPVEQAVAAVEKDSFQPPVAAPPLLSARFGLFSGLDEYRNRAVWIVRFSHVTIPYAALVSGSWTGNRNYVVDAVTGRVLESFSMTGG
jgi:hypothetical protein